MTARILNGENLAGITPEAPRIVELVLNVKEATNMGLKPSMDLMTDATRVIK